MRLHGGRAARGLVLAAGVCLSWLGGAAAAAGTGPVSISVSGGPAGELVVKPGGSVATTFVVRNPASYSQHIEVAITGLRVADGAYLFEGEPSPGLGVTAKPARFEAGPRSARDVLIVLRAAESISPGSALAGVVFRSVPAAGAGESPVIGEVAFPLIGRAPGRVVDTGRIVSFAPARPSFEGPPIELVLRFENTGTVHYVPTGSVEILAGNRPVGAVAVEEKVVLPGTERTLRAVWKGRTPTGTLQARLHLRWGLEGQYSDTRETVVRVGPASVEQDPEGSWWSPWLWLLLLLLLVVAYLVARRARARRQARTAAASRRESLATAPAGRL